MKIEDVTFLWWFSGYIYSRLVTSSIFVGGNALAASAFVTGLPQVAAAASVLSFATASSLSWYHRNELMDLQKVVSLSIRS
jgi:hypothetical protein